MVAAVWVLVDAHTGNADNGGRIRAVAMTSTALIWLAYLAAGYFHAPYDGADKAIIKDGPWPWAHGLFMEGKEQVFFLTLLLANLLPIAASGPDRGVLPDHAVTRCVKTQARDRVPQGARKCLESLSPWP